MPYIPEKINDFNVYNSGNVLVGITDEVTLAELEAMTETISGPGILGEIDSPNVGHFGSIEQEIPFRVLIGNAVALIKVGDAVDLTLRGSVQLMTPSGGKKFVGMRIVMRGGCKSISLGSVKAGSPMNATVKLELTYIYLEMDGEPMIELDKINGTYEVGGVDQMAKIKALC